MKHREMFGNARWVLPAGSPDAALFRKSFAVTDPQNARITICGLGYFVLYLNGRRVGSDEFVPPVSDYHARPDMTLSYPLNDRQSHRIYCMRYDVADYLTAGENVIAIMVGGGFYHQTRRLAEGNMSYGDVKLCFRIETPDAEIVSDVDMICSRGFFESANLFHGEVQNFTGFDRGWNTRDSDCFDWQKVLLGEPPESKYYLADCPTDKAQESLIPELVRDFGAYSVYRVSRNITGYPVISCTAPGETVELECAENINPDGTLNNRSVGYGRQRQCATFVTDSESLYHPVFTWFGFRYFTLTNNAKPVEVRVIHADVPVTSAFHCSDTLLNWYYETFLNTQQCNMHGSIPSDCPHRERLGYTGDGQLTCDAVLTEFDAAAFYRKWIADIEDCQDADTGHVQHTAPFAGGGGGPAGWGGAIIVVPYTYYRHTADVALLKRMYPKMQTFVRYMESRCENGLIVREEKDGWCLGEWCTPQKVTIPEPFVNTTMYISQLQMLAYCARDLSDDPEPYLALIETHKKAVNDTYLQGDSFCGGTQGADAFALDCGLGSENTRSALVERYRALGEFDTGIFGTPILLRTLFENGQEDLAYQLLSNRKDGSFDAMRRAGATTLWENWNGEASHNHPMFGASTVCLFRYILGIRQADGASGMRDLVISPVFPNGLEFAQGSVSTPQGKIAVQWERQPEGIRIQIRLCDGIQAVFRAYGQERTLYAGENILMIR